VFNIDKANACISELIFLLMAEQFPYTQLNTFDGFYLRENEPFTASNGADLNISHYIIKPETDITPMKSESRWKLSYKQFKKKSKQLLGNILNPEAIGQYEGYHIGNN